MVMFHVSVAYFPQCHMTNLKKALSHAATSLAAMLRITKSYSGADFWQNRGFNDKSVKTSKIVQLDLLIKIGYGPIA